MHAPRLRRVTLRSAISIVAILCALTLGALAVRAATTDRAVTSKRAPAFIVKGELAAPLRPGSTSQVKIGVANKKYTRIWIKSLRLSVSVDAAHAAAGCSVARDFEIVQLPKKAFPLRLAAAKKPKKRRGKKRKATVRWRAFPAGKARGLPTIGMRNLADVNQDACKGATLNLKFTGKATNKKPKTKARR